MKHYRAALPLIFAVGLLALACNPAATPIVVPTATPAPSPTLEPGLPTSTPSPTITPASDRPLVTIGEATFVVELADTPEKRGHGLSGRPGLEPGTGMLFVFDSEGRFVFWMRGMEIPLDFVWISADCVVVDLTENVPPPEPGAETQDLIRYQPEVPVRYVLEINAGEIESAGISMAAPVSFGGTLAGVYGC